jgi:hypothetical protein
LENFDGPSQSVVSHAASDADKKDWQLMLDLNLGEFSQSWILVYQAETTMGRGKPKEIVHTVCALVKQTGGSITEAKQ